MDQPSSTPAPTGIGTLQGVSPAVMQAFDPSMFGRMLLNRQGPTNLPGPQGASAQPVRQGQALDLLTALQQQGAAAAAQRINAPAAGQSGKGSKGGGHPLAQVIAKQVSDQPSNRNTINMLQQLSPQSTQSPGGLPGAYLQR